MNFPHFIASEIENLKTYAFGELEGEVASLALEHGVRHSLPLNKTFQFLHCVNWCG